MTRIAATGRRPPVIPPCEPPLEPNAPQNPPQSARPLAGGGGKEGGGGRAPSWPLESESSVRPGGKDQARIAGRVHDSDPIRLLPAGRLRPAGGPVAWPDRAHTGPLRQRPVAGAGCRPNPLRPLARPFSRPGLVPRRASWAAVGMAVTA